MRELRELRLVGWCPDRRRTEYGTAQPSSAPDTAGQHSRRGRRRSWRLTQVVTQARTRRDSSDSAQLYGCTWSVHASPSQKRSPLGLRGSVYQPAGGDGGAGEGSGLSLGAEMTVSDIADERMADTLASYHWEHSANVARMVTSGTDTESGETPWVLAK